ncbi:MAG: hypothetical protein ACOYOV_02850 [Bacteroidales bacterium]
METEVKRIRSFSQALNVLTTMKFLVDDDRFLENEEFQTLTIQQIMDFFLESVNLEGLQIFILKPVIAAVTVLPSSNLNAGDRYFSTEGNAAMSIAEFNGTSWVYVETFHGDCFYCFLNHKFIVRKADSFEYSEGGTTYQHPNHSGDVASVGDGLMTISQKAVTLDKMADMDGGSLMYRKSNGAGPPETQSLKTLRSDLGITTLKPVLAIVSRLPEDLLKSGDRYFFGSGGMSFKIAEYDGNDWMISNTGESDTFYCYALKSFIVRLKDGYDIALGNMNLPAMFTPDVVNEPMRGIVDGVNKSFTTLNEFEAGSLAVFVNGINERYFSIQSSDSIRFDTAPAEDSIILAIYKKKL